MQPDFIRAGILALCLSIIALVSWEIYIRQKNLPLSYDDNEALWADKRAMVYEPQDQATVFIGSSRIKYDLDIPTWESITGNHAIQLANVGSSPRPVLEDLSNDKNFKGNLIVGVTENLFFADFSHNDGLTNKKIDYYHKITPTQRSSFQVNRVLEGLFDFLDQQNFSLNAMLDQIHLSQRPGVIPNRIFPSDFGRVSFTRQSSMTPRFVADTNLQNQVKAIWAFVGKKNAIPPPTGKKLDSILGSVKTLVNKIKERGGHVLFVRAPSSGQFRQVELKNYPRTVYLDRLLAITGCQGIYFEDY